jgi:hypothetical protein
VGVSEMTAAIYQAKKSIFDFVWHIQQQYPIFLIDFLLQIHIFLCILFYSELSIVSKLKKNKSF